MTDFTADERALLDEAARAVVARRLAVPAMMFLETVTPMNVVSSSMLHMLTPVWRMALPAARLELLARLLERREAIPELIRLLDEREDERRRTERRERRARREVRRPPRRWALTRPFRRSSRPPAPDAGPNDEEPPP